MAMAKRFVQNPGNSAICYYRYSSASQNDASIEQQQDAAKAYAKAHNLRIVKEYPDRAMSGTRDDRPEFQKMQYEVQHLRPAYLILWKMDRLSRDKYDAVMTKKYMRDHGVKIVYVAESIPEDDEESALLLESVLEATAQTYIMNLRKNVMRGLTSNANAALYNGVHIYGYTAKKKEPYKINQKEAPVVKRIFTEYADGVPLKKIADGLNEAGIKTAKGNDFTINSLRRILTNPSYTGRYKWGDIEFPDKMPRIIDDDLFAKTGLLLKANKRGGKGGAKKVNPELDIADYWLTGHIFCACCGSTMQGVSGTGKSGKTFFYYSCKNHRHRACSMKNKRKDIIESVVYYLLSELMKDEAVRIVIAKKCFEYYKEQYDDGDSFEKSLEAQLKDVDKKLSNMIKAIEEGIRTDTTLQRMQELEFQKKMLTDELVAEQNRKKYDLKLKDIVKYLEVFFGDIKDPENRQKLLEFLVDKIIVDNDKLTVTLHFTGDNRELSYDDTMELIKGRKAINDALDGNIPEVTESLNNAAKSLLDSGGGGADFFQ